MASAAICAGRQGLYWEMHDKLFETGATTREAFAALIPADSMEPDSFDECLEDEMPLEVIERDARIAEDLGLNGTPGFAFGRTTTTSSEVLITKLIQGAQPLTVFEASIDEIATAEDSGE